MTREDTLKTALNIVTGNRNADYGPPERNLETIAAFWSVYLSARHNTPITVEAHDVAVLNILQKVSRIVQSPDKEDSWTDICGYAACGAEVATETKTLRIAPLAERAAKWGPTQPLTETPKMLKCRLCDYETAYPSGPPPFRCARCSKTFTP